MNDINLSPAQATMFIDHIPVPFAGALEQDQQGAGEQASFKIPLKWKPLIQRIVADPRFGYGMQPSRFYLHAVGEMLMFYARALRGDDYYTSITQELRDLHELAYVNDIMTRFEDLLSRVDKQAEQVMQSKNEERAFNWLHRIVTFVRNQEMKDDHLGEILGGMARKHDPLREMLQLVAQSQAYGGSRSVDAIQNFFVG